MMEDQLNEYEDEVGIEKIVRSRSLNTPHPERLELKSCYHNKRKSRRWLRNCLGKELFQLPNIVETRRGSYAQQSWKGRTIVLYFSFQRYRKVFWILSEGTNELDIIPPEQFGSRSCHSTELKMLKLVEIITNRFRTRQVIRMVFLGVRTAFDRVW